MKILIIDDEPVNVALLEEILIEKEYTRFESVIDSKQAVDVYGRFRPDLVLLDLMMPPPDGFAILERLRVEAPETFLPIVVLTADTNEETKRRALEAGATDFLLKPFDHVEVALRIRNLLKSRRAHLLLDNQRAALEDAVRERTAELRATIAQLEKANDLLMPSTTLTAE
ncbi:MAG: response regulator [Verrucomicrobia bacterium]|nr:response regulator [Verrucomicrobiota bacterium]